MSVFTQSFEFRLTSDNGHYITCAGEWVQSPTSYSLICCCNFIFTSLALMWARIS